MASIRASVGFALLLLLVVTGAGCKQEEQAKNGINGDVTVDGNLAADVTVELFEEPNLDSTTVWYYTTRNTSVGFRYAPEAAFDWRRDHRLVLAGIATGSDGKFQFQDLPDNDYIICARKRFEIDGILYWAWTLPKVVSLRGSSADIGTLRLYEPISVPRTPITTATTWEGNGRHYILQGDLNVQAGASLTIEPGAFVQLPYNGRILNSGQLTAVGSERQYISFTSISEDPTPGDWRYIASLLGSSAPAFEYCRFDYADDAVRATYTPGAIFNHCYFSNLASQGLTTVGDLDDELVTVERCVFNGISVAADFFGNETVYIRHNIFFSDRSYGLKLQNTRNGEIFCNWFQDCGRFDTSAGERSGVMFLGDLQNFEIHQNNIIESAYAHDVGSKVDSTVYIHHNTYQSINRVLNIGVTEEELGYSNPRFNYCSMISIDKINVIVLACHINTHNVDCTNNFWNRSSADDVRRQLINDCSDDEEGNISFILVDPILMQAPSDAGICRN